MKFTCSKCGIQEELSLWSRLTPRGREVAELLLEGYKTAEIAKQLGIEARTIKAHMNKMFHIARIDTKIYQGRIRLAQILYEERSLWTKESDAERIRNLDSISSRNDK